VDIQTVRHPHMMRALPQDVLVLVLRHVDQAERFSSCALVSTAWAKAAAMASDAVSICTSDLEPCITWLQHHGSHVTRFDCAYDEARDDRGVLSTLPCKNLQELILHDWDIPLGPMEGRPGLLHAVTGLTKLHLDLQDQENLVGDLLSLTALHALPALQHFNLSVRECLDHYGPDVSDELPTSVISGFTSLVRLELSGEVGVQSLQPFSSLTRLQHLNLDFNVVVGDNEEAVQLGQQPFAQLQALTHISISIPDCELVSTSSSPAFSGSTGLQELNLYYTVIDPWAFHGLTALRSLELFVNPADQRGIAGGVAVLLRHIASMQHLQRLVFSTGYAASLAVGGAAAELCGAVTTSAHLAYLNLIGLRLPRNAWVHMFPPGRRLPQLHGFEVCFAAPAPSVDPNQFDCVALGQMVNCCPAIKCLSYSNLSLFEQNMSLAPLLRLQQLARLECPYVVDGAASIGVLARLPSLTSLHMHAWPSLSEAGLLQLTALTGLQELAVTAQGDRYKSLSVLEGSFFFRATVSTLAALRVCCTPCGDLFGSVQSQ
jgi:hypothetical protein